MTTRVIEAADEPAIHNGVECDGCQQCPIRGPRFRSRTRANFDLCEECVQKDEHNTDEYIKIDRPADEHEWVCKWERCAGCTSQSAVHTCGLTMWTTMGDEDRYHVQVLRGRSR